MRKLFFLLIAAFSCTGRNYDPSAHLSAKKQDETLRKIMRYIAKAPEGISSSERFYSAYDDYYREQQARYIIAAWYTSRAQHYFLVTRPAPSITEKRVAIGGRLSLDAQGEIQLYEEVFRTWKMRPDSLKTKSLMLFDKMVKGESLEKYQTRFTRPYEYIEFPDERTFYDKEAREWRLK